MHCKSYSHFFSKKFQHIRVSLDVNFNDLLTNDVVSFEQLGPEVKTGEKVRHFVVVVCCYFPAKIYLADIYQKPLGRTVLMRTHNI